MRSMRAGCASNVRTPATVATFREEGRSRSPGYFKRTSSSCQRENRSGTESVIYPPRPRRPCNGDRRAAAHDRNPTGLELQLAKLVLTEIRTECALDFGKEGPNP